MIKHSNGLAAARFIKTSFAGDGDDRAALAYAETQAWRDTPEVAWVYRSAVAPSTSNNQGVLGDVGIDFSAFIRPASLIGRIQGFRQIPLRTRILAGIGGTTVTWVGDAMPAPVTAAAFEGLVLPRLKVVGVAVTSKELLRDASVKADSTLANDMRAASSKALDLAFIDPSNAGQATVRPASITYGVTPLDSSGSSVSQIDSDLEAMIGQLIAAGSDLSNALWVMGSSTATALSLKRGSGGALAYPGMSVAGGQLAGLPAFATAHMPGNSSGTFIVLVDASAIALGDESASEFTVSTSGTLQMSDTPHATSPVQLVPLFQTESAAIKVVRYLNWHLRSADYVSVLSGVDY